jgi:hypothetical protein
VQGRAVLSKKWFMEGSFSTLKELTSGQFDDNLSVSDLTNYKARTTYNYKEIGLGKILSLNQECSNNVLLSAGYGYTKYKSDFELTSNSNRENTDFNFNNNHIFFNTQFQFDFGKVKYQIGIKSNLVNFKNVNTNNKLYLGKEENILQNETNGFKVSTQFYNDIGVYPFKENKWLGIHAGFSLSNRMAVENRFRNRTLGANISLMANPSGIFKKKK